MTLEKVEKEPVIYVLPEVNEKAEGVANWFKLVGDLDLQAPMEFPDGKYSIRDSVEEIAGCPQALEVVCLALETILKRKIVPGEGSWDMIKSMSLEMVCNMTGAGALDGFMESLNGRLTRIDKV